MKTTKICLNCSRPLWVVGTKLGCITPPCKYEEPLPEDIRMILMGEAMAPRLI